MAVTEGHIITNNSILNTPQLLLPLNLFCLLIMMSLICTTQNITPPQPKVRCGLNEGIILQPAVEMSRNRVDCAALRQWTDKNETEPLPTGTRGWKNSLDGKAKEEYEALLAQENFTVRMVIGDYVLDINASHRNIGRLIYD